MSWFCNFRSKWNGLSGCVVVTYFFLTIVSTHNSITWAVSNASVNWPLCYCFYFFDITFTYYSMEATLYLSPSLPLSLSLFLSFKNTLSKYRSSHPEVFLGKDVLKICSNFTGEHQCRSAISIKLQSNFI